MRGVPPSPPGSLHLSGLCPGHPRRRSPGPGAVTGRGGRPGLAPHCGRRRAAGREGGARCEGRGPGGAGVKVKAAEGRGRPGRCLLLGGHRPPAVPRRCGPAVPGRAARGALRRGARSVPQMASPAPCPPRRLRTVSGGGGMFPVAPGGTMVPRAFAEPGAGLSVPSGVCGRQRHLAPFSLFQR